MTDLAATRAAQALAILDALESLPVGSSLYIDRTYSGADVTVFHVQARNRHHGESVTDALGQCCQVLASEAP